ncbi:hypothetical protein AVEN_269095-1 [Araneus ventricosus]|uniref:Uncharacterized protein n=1 Tax=Araneus ventricosus TaxID=182803 RepID=A0A4Y2LBT0_ARAVE|nr:hypothetical protein AVEN_269095-1 [Araneus ventricosus]
MDGKTIRRSKKRKCYGNRFSTSNDVSTLVAGTSAEVMLTCCEKRLQTFQEHFREDTLGRGRSVWTPQVVDDILQRVEDRPDISTPEVSRAVNVPHSIVWRVLRGEGLHPYRVQKVQAFIPADHAPRVEFAHWFLKQLAEQPDFIAHVLLTDESTFTPEGISNTHSLHVWASSNPHGTRPHEYQKCISVNVWAGIVDDHLISPYILPFRLDSRTYLTFLQRVLPELLQPVAENIRARVWFQFQQDGAPPHFSLDVRSALGAKFPRRLVGVGPHIGRHPHPISPVWTFSCGAI